MPGCYITGQKESDYYVENTVKVKAVPQHTMEEQGGKEV
jgi:hypothetical protein